MIRRKGMVTTGKSSVLSLFFVPHRGKVRTLRIPHYKALFSWIVLTAVVLSVYGTVAFLHAQSENRAANMALEAENAELRLVLDMDGERYEKEIARLNSLVAEQESVLKETEATMAGFEAGTALSSKTLDNYKAEYEGMVAAYIDMNMKSVNVSRGNDGNRSFKSDVAMLKLLLETAESAALDADDKTSELAEQAAKLDSYIKSLPSSWPTSPGATVASDFGRRLHPVYHYYKVHEGLDIGEKKGDPIYAAGSGIVIAAERRSGYGNLVEIDHGNGYVTRYGHCSKILVSAGQHVGQGEKIAFMGATGTATGPHLHFEVRINDKAVNPEMFLTY